MGKHSFWLNSTFLAGFSHREVYVLLTTPSKRIVHNNYLLTTNNTQQLKTTVSRIEYHVEQQPHVHWLVLCPHLQRIQKPLASSIVSFGAKNIPNFSQKEAQLQMLDNSWYWAEDTAQSDHNHEDAIISHHKCWVLGFLMKRVNPT